MRYAVIKNGRVDNIIVADADHAASIGAIDATGAQIGNAWDGVAFSKHPDQIKAETNAGLLAEIVAAEHPAGFTRRQREFLIANSAPGPLKTALGAIEDLIAAKRAALIW